MKILFVHQNFPGQFRHLAPALLALGHEVRALTPATNQNPSPVPIARYPFTRKPFPISTYGLSAHFAEQTHLAEAVATAADKLAQTDGYKPNVILGHAGWGETLFLGEVWPSARRLAYAEFFYRPHGLDVGFDPEFDSPSLRQSLWVRSRQAAQLLALSDAHRAITPTRWQASTFPDFLQPLLRIIPEGVDTSTIKPNPAATFALPNSGPTLRRGDEVLTFVSRNLEPYRGYHIFMRTLPEIMRMRRNAQVVIVGGDGVSYGPRPPSGTVSWKQRFLNEVSDQIDLKRVHFVGRIAHARLISLMQVTKVHAYLTYPFVLSWSLLEAMSAGALIIASKTPPVEEIIENADNGFLIDFFDIDGWAKTIIAALSHKDFGDDLRRNARARIVADFDLKSRCLPLQIAEVAGG